MVPLGVVQGEATDLDAAEEVEDAVFAQPGMGKMS